MQIRIANRQDDKGIRALVEALYKDQGRSLDLDDKDADLRNIERYFARAGLFLVAEDQGEIKAILAADKENEQTLMLRRLMGTAGQTVLEQMMAIALNHAYQLDFEKFVVADDVSNFTDNHLSRFKIKPK